MPFLITAAERTLYMNNSRIHAITVGNSLIKAQVITDIQSAFCITHGGRFHADDLFAAAIMLPNTKVADATLQRRKQLLLANQKVLKEK